MSRRLSLIATLAILALARATLAEDCRADGRLAVEVEFEVPPDNNPSTVTLELDYPAALVGLPGRRNDDSVSARFSDFPAAAVRVVNDQDGRVRVVIAGTEVLAPGRLFRVDFDRCTGAAKPAAEAFVCRVLGCAGSYGKVNRCACRARFAAHEGS